jgi:7-carboxy-7-deazaguanine synthase
MSDIRISEIFGPTIQGEGPLIGKPTVFVRTAGCDFRCAWCDTFYAVLPEFHDEWTFMSDADVLLEINKLAGDRPILVSLSGGNPALQPLQGLIETGHAQGHRFALETQGSIAQTWFAELDWLILSPKPPSSKMETDWNALADCIAAAGGRPQIALKIVIFDDEDFEFARSVWAHFPKLPVFLQPGNPMQAPALCTGDLLERLSWLTEKTKHVQWHEVHVLPQLHVLMWGNKRGV